jgi:hypothetical protein
VATPAYKKLLKSGELRTSTIYALFHEGHHIDAIDSWIWEGRSDDEARSRIESLINLLEATWVHGYPMHPKTIEWISTHRLFINLMNGGSCPRTLKDMQRERDLEAMWAAADATSSK